MKPSSRSRWFAVATCVALVACGGGGEPLDPTAPHSVQLADVIVDTERGTGVLAVAGEGQSTALLAMDGYPEATSVVRSGAQPGEAALPTPSGASGRVSPRTMSVAPGDPNVVVVVGYVDPEEDTYSPVIWRSTDAGASFTVLPDAAIAGMPPDTGLSDVVAAGDRLVASAILSDADEKAPWGVVVSDDDGATWAHVELDPSGATDPQGLGTNGDSVVAIAEDEEYRQFAWVSSDPGRSWSGPARLPRDVEESGFASSVAWSAGAAAWVVTGRGTAWRSADAVDWEDLDLRNELGHIPSSLNVSRVGEAVVVSGDDHNGNGIAWIIDSAGPPRLVELPDDPSVFGMALGPPVGPALVTWNGELVPLDLENASAG